MQGSCCPRVVGQGEIIQEKYLRIKMAGGNCLRGNLMGATVQEELFSGNCPEGIS